MTTAHAAAKPTARPPATPLAAAQAEVTRLSKKRHELLDQGADLDRAQLAQVDDELTAAGERLGAADLAAKRAGSRAPFNVDKFCAQQSRVSDLQQTVANRSVEFNEVHSLRNALKNAIETFEASEDSRILARSLQDAGRGQKMREEDLKIAREIADLRERLIAAEVARTRAAAALAEVKARSHTETAVFESWREAVLRLPGGARMLQDLPKPHKPSDSHGLDRRGNLISDSSWYTGRNAAAPAEAPGSAPAPAAASSAAAPAAAASAQPAARSAAAMWGKAGTRTNAQHGLAPAHEAFIAPASTASLIAAINDDPEVLSLLAERARAGNLTSAEGFAALEAMRPSSEKPFGRAPRAQKSRATKTAPKAAAKVKPAAAKSGLSRFKLGFRGIRS